MSRVPLENASALPDRLAIGAAHPNYKSHYNWISAKHSKYPTGEEKPAISAKKTQPIESGAADEQRQAEERQYRKQQLWAQWFLNIVTFAAALAGMGGLVILCGTLRATRKAADAAKAQAQVALDALHSQRANIGFGSPDGKFVDYVAPKRGQRKGALIVHFRNTGNFGASSVKVNAYSMITSHVNWGGDHLLRYVIEYPKGYLGTVGSASGGDVAAHTPFDVPLDDKWVPMPAQWAQIQSGKWLQGAGFSVFGTFEYCDNFGQYHCDGFSARYVPPPVDNFVQQATMPCFAGPPSIKEIPEPNRKYFVRFLDRCRQPNEASPYEAQK